jgi:hypothetical protein
MTVYVSTLVALACPPHYWYIMSDGTGQQWTCQRCGVAKTRPEPAEPTVPWRHSGRPAPGADRP